MDKIRYGFVVLVSIIIGVLPLNAKTLTDVITYETMGLNSNKDDKIISPTEGPGYNVTFTPNSITLDPADKGPFTPKEMINSGAEYYSTMFSALQSSSLSKGPFLRFKYYPNNKSKTTIFRSEKSPGIVKSITILGYPDQKQEYCLELYGLKENETGDGNLITSVNSKFDKTIQSLLEDKDYTNLIIRASAVPESQGSTITNTIGGIIIEWEVEDSLVPAFAEKTVTVPISNRGICTLQQLSNLNDGATVVYESSNSSVAEILDESNGQKLNIRTPGRTTITATCDDGTSDSYELIVESTAPFESACYQRVSNPLMLATTGKYALVSDQGRLFDGANNSTIISNFDASSETCNITSSNLPDISFDYDTELNCYLAINDQYIDGKTIGQLNETEGMDPAHRVTLSTDNHITWPETGTILCFDATSGQLTTAASDAEAKPALLYRNIQEAGTPFSPSVASVNNGDSKYELGYSANKEGSYWYIYFDEDTFNLTLTPNDPDNEEVWYRNETSRQTAPRRVAAANDDNDGYDKFLNDIKLSQGSHVISFYSFNPATRLKSPVERLSVEIMTGINAIGSESPTSTYYYNVNGIRVDNPGKGIFIRRDGDKTVKIIR